jgi:hypothetical protein
MAERDGKNDNLLFRIRDRSANGALRCNACLGERIIAGIKVFAILDEIINISQSACCAQAHFLHLCEDVLVSGQLSVETEKFFLLLRQFL